MIEEAQWYVDSGRGREALDALRDVDPEDVRTWELRARALYQLGRFAESEENARRALALFPENVVLLELLAAIQLETKPKAAEATLRSALELDPENLRLLQLGVMILLRQRRHEAAEQMLERAMRIAPEECVRVRAAFMVEAAESHRSMEASQELLRAFPDDAYSHYVSGLAALNGPWSWPRGLRHLRQAAALSPGDPVLVETARLMNAWWVLPLHATSGGMHTVIALAIGIPGFVIWSETGDLRLLLALAAFVVAKWIFFFAIRFLLPRRITRAFRNS